jgi:hypothetical protein
VSSIRLICTAALTTLLAWVMGCGSEQATGTSEDISYICGTADVLRLAGRTPIDSSDGSIHSTAPLLSNRMRSTGDLQLTELADRIDAAIDRADAESFESSIQSVLAWCRSPGRSAPTTPSRP